MYIYIYIPAQWSIAIDIGAHLRRRSAFRPWPSSRPAAVQRNGRCTWGSPGEVPTVPRSTVYVDVSNHLKEKKTKEIIEIKFQSKNGVFFFNHFLDVYIM